MDPVDPVDPCISFSCSIFCKLVKSADSWGVLAGSLSEPSLLSPSQSLDLPPDPPAPNGSTPPPLPLFAARSSSSPAAGSVHLQPTGSGSVPPPVHRTPAGLVSWAGLVSDGFFVCLCWVTAGPVDWTDWGCDWFGIAFFLERPVDPQEYRENRAAGRSMSPVRSGPAPRWGPIRTWFYPLLPTQETFILQSIIY